MSRKTSIQAIGVTSLGTDIEEVEQLIRERAYQRFLERGSEPGNPVEDWLSAESAVISRPSVNVSEQGKNIVAEIDVAGVSPEQLQVKTDGRLLIVRSVQTPQKKDSAGLSQLFCAIEFPRPIDRNDVRAEYRKGTLRIIGSAERSGGMEMSA